MRCILMLLLLCSSVVLSAQTKNNLFFAIQLQPELTYYKNNYAYRWRETYTKSTYNIGIEATLQYRLTKRLFAETGLGYISRKLNTVVFLNQGALPPPRQSFTLELVNTKSVSVRTLQVPLNLGYDVIALKRIQLNLVTGITGNYLLNAYYGLGGLKQYEGTYKKNYWQGYAVNLGLGMNYTINKTVSLTNRITYSVYNTVKEDAYLFSQDQYGIALTHEYLRLSVGLRMRL
ncbi:MAG: outer membrane beta-barrel protein [Bacteroidota bacterium]